VPLVAQACASLAEAHHRGMVHRDVKPSNLLTTRNGLEHDFVKVLDFGLVKEEPGPEEALLTAPRTATGTPAYMAPELALGEPFDGRADVYALGCVLSWLVTGRLVFIYRDNFSRPLQAYLEQTGKAEAAPADARGAAERASRTGRIHSDWLNMMYPRLFLARQLLRDDGVIFISCDDNEVHHLRVLMNELFGEENFLATAIWQRVYAPKNTARHFSDDHDYIVVYGRNADIWAPTLLPRSEEAKARYENANKERFERLNHRIRGIPMTIVVDQAPACDWCGPAGSPRPPGIHSYCSSVSPPTMRSA